MAKPPLISITIKKPEQTVFDGFATAVTSISKQGKFDVLAYHSNFIALIEETIVLELENKPPVEFPIKNGVMKVQENIVKIILGVETKAAKTNP